MLKILHIVSGLGSGGVESMLHNYYINMDKRKVKFDFIVHDPNIGKLEEDFKKLGCEVFHVTPKKDSLFNNALDIFQIIKKGDYDIIHSHQNASSFLALFFARLNKIKVRIAHSHVGILKEKTSRKMLLLPFKILTKYFSTDRFACSVIASNWLFGKKNKDIIIINNAIDLEKFKYNSLLRTEVRQKYGWDDKFVIGNVARFFPEKNHEFLIRIFKEIHKLIPTAILILVGGEEKEEEKRVRRLTQVLGVNEHVIFLGVRDDVNKLMQAMDSFILPSKFEGFGMVLVEAQASSLKCFTSDNVPKETRITNLIEYISLENSEKYWAEKVIDSTYGYNRKKYDENVSRSNFDIQTEAVKLSKIYFDLYKTRYLK
ncbi:glycosyltransferase [Fictibacillus norfolkensis]|uniref:Glycosyltransferase n=1 Tax=Fictibacillus norfolkensis TaxID=2762233 RepID=A0ABR8SN44_9BACL|nr:glycosyltransferase [Fictibacillus norfolkensis]MBD7964912.1 glycosyltransferase [Fictibacillus norfolkensis]